MPIVAVSLLEGRTPAQKRAFIRAVSQAAVETLDVPEEAVRIILTEVAPDHWGVGSSSMAELRPSHPMGQAGRRPRLEARCRFSGMKAMNEDPSPDIIEQLSPLSFDDTLTRLEEAIGSSGMAIFARIDHAANARSVDMIMPPATVLVYGAPKGGTPIMLAAPVAALDLPLHILVREQEDGTTVIAFHPITEVLRRAGVLEEVAARLESAQHVLLQAVAP